MANVTRIKVKLGDRWNDPDRNFREMLIDFRTKVSDAGILHEYKEAQVFTSKSEKKRKKRREAKSRNQQAMIEQKLKNGDPVRAPSGLIKRVLARKKKDQDRKKQRKEQSF